MSLTRNTFPIFIKIIPEAFKAMLGWFHRYFTVTVGYSPGANASSLPRPASIIIKKKLHVPDHALNHNAIFNHFIAQMMHDGHSSSSG
jgi:hypothetical protein